VVVVVLGVGTVVGVRGGGATIVVDVVVTGSVVVVVVVVVVVLVVGTVVVEVAVGSIGGWALATGDNAMVSAAVRPAATAAPTARRERRAGRRCGTEEVRRAGVDMGVHWCIGTDVMRVEHESGGVSTQCPEVDIR
jgi:hypothetical protein